MIFSIKKIETLEIEIEELKKQRNSRNTDKSRDLSFNAESPVVEKTLKSNFINQQIKRECEKNDFFEEDIKVISKKEDQEIREKIREFEKKIRDLQKDKEENFQLRENLEKILAENRVKIEKITHENKGLVFQKEQILFEKNQIFEEKKEIRSELEILRKKLAFYEKKVKFFFAKKPLFFRIKKTCFFFFVKKPFFS